MKIAQVAPLYEAVPPITYGGTERVVSFLTEELVKQGHEVTLFASGDSITQAELVSIIDRSLRLSPVPLDGEPYHVRQIQEVMNRRANFDVIHFHTDYQHFPVSRATGCPQLTTLHGRLDRPELEPLFREFTDMPLVSISDSQRTPLPYANWIATVQHGLPLNLLHPVYTAGKYLAFLGRISPEKGIDRAVEIAERAGIPLKVAAKVDRADREYFETLIEPLFRNSKFVEFIGEIGEVEKQEFLGNALGLLFPINWPEPFGLVMIEAMACGTPVIAYNRGSVPEVLTDGKNGFRVSSIDEAVLAIEQLGTICRRTCRAEFERRFSAGRMATDYVEQYGNVRAEANRRPFVDFRRHHPGAQPVLRAGERFPQHAANAGTEAGR